MTESTLYPIPTNFANQANINASEYAKMYAQSIADPSAFWEKQAKQFITFFSTYARVLSGSFEENNVVWFEAAKLNVCYNVLDRHLAVFADKTAIIWEGNESSQSRQLTYQALYEQVCCFANVLKKHGVKKGDRVAIYLPMIPEAIIAMLACARIGAVHSVIFAGFAADAIKTRILDADCRLIITADNAFRGTKIIPLKKNIDIALQDCGVVETVIVFQHTTLSCDFKLGRDYWYHEEKKTVSETCPCEVMDANDLLFILYTSGSTGKPKGIAHTSAAYLLYTAATFYAIFDYKQDDIFWCTADIGWITGHSYVVYGPLTHAATIVIYEGLPHYPSASRYWELVDKYKITVLYTAPTAIRALRQAGDNYLQSSSRASLRLLGTVGEPINPDVWEWYYHVVGQERCPIVDTWWQTETGGVLISPLPGATALKAGAASTPFFGIKPLIVDEDGKPLPANQKGKLLISAPWPGMLKTIYGNPDRFLEAYFKTFPGYYLTGDDAYCDTDGYIWIIGRNDDILKIAGHRIGSAEVENAILMYPAVAEAAVVSVPDQIKGEAIYAFITLKAGEIANENMKKAIVQQVRNSLGAIATLQYIQWAEALPKTRSGKIMRRLLRKIANNDLADLGDVSTLTDLHVLDRVIAERLVL